jgi:hypothetical protein
VEGVMIIIRISKPSSVISFLVLFCLYTEFSAFQHHLSRHSVKNAASISDSRYYSFMGHKAQSKSLLLDAASDKAASDAATSAAYEFMQSQGEWYDMGGCSVLLPMERTPRSIIHFVGREV